MVKVFSSEIVAFFFRFAPLSNTRSSSISISRISPSWSINQYLFVLINSNDINFSAYSTIKISYKFQQCYQTQVFGFCSEFGMFNVRLPSTRKPKHETFNIDLNVSTNPPKKRWTRNAHTFCFLIVNIIRVVYYCGYRKSVCYGLNGAEKEQKKIGTQTKFINIFLPARRMNRLTRDLLSVTAAPK